VINEFCCSLGKKIVNAYTPCWKFPTRDVNWWMGLCFYSKLNKKPLYFTNWRHISGIINKVYNSCKYRNKLVHCVIENKVLYYYMYYYIYMLYYINYYIYYYIEYFILYHTVYQFISIFTTVSLETPTQPILVFTSLAFKLYNNLLQKDKYNVLHWISDRSAKMIIIVYVY